MPYPGANFSSEPALGTHISKEAIQRVHEQIFGNPFSSSNHSRPDCPSPRSRNPKYLLPCPEFTLKHGSSSIIFLNKNDARNKLSFYFAVDPLSRIVLRFHSYDFSLGVLPGDMVLSINDVDFQQLSIDEVNVKLSSEGPSDLKLVLLPSEDNIEWSVRSIHVDYSYLGNTITRFGGYGVSHNHSYEELFARQDHNSNRICLREWIKSNGSLSGVSGLITELYMHLLRDITSDPKGLCFVGDLVLVSHRDGYSMGTVADVLPEDGYHVKLHPNNLFLTVSLDSISRANNRELDGMEDLMLLRHLNEVAVVFNLHARILNALPYTYAGDFALLSFNPMRSLDIYNDAVKHLFLKCRHRLDMPPHIFSVPQTILYRMENALLARSPVAVVGGISPSDDGDPSFNRRSLVSTTSSVATTVQVPTQAVCLLGRSGSGKSVNTEHLIEYFLFHSPSNSALTARKVRAIMCLLDAFTCSRTLLNSNASRCLRLFTLEFVSESRDSSEIQLYPSNLFVDILLLDKFRVTRRPQGEPTFHIFYYFLAGLENDVRSEYMLEDLTSPNLFMTPLQRLEDQALAKSRWKAVREAARVLGEAFEEAFVQGVCRLLAAIYHLGCAGAAPEQSGRPSTSSPARRFINLSAAERASRLLGCNSVDCLTSEVFGSAPSVDISTAHTPNNLEFLGGFVANLYAIATNALRDLINKAMNPTSSSDMDLRARVGRVVIVDPPGLQTPEAGGRMSGGSLEDLLYNYTNECLLQFYRNCQCQADEGGNIKATNPDFVDFLDKPSDNFLLSQCQNSGSARLSLSRKGDTPSRTSSVTLSQSDEESSIIWAPERSGDGSSSNSSTGLLWLLDYACCTGDMKTFLRLIAQKYVDHKRIHTSRESRLLRRLHRSGAFSLNHWNATAVVQYHPSTWLSSCHYSNNPRPNIELLQRSQLPLLRDIGDSIDEGASASALSVSSSAGLVGTFIQDTKYVVDLLRSCFFGTTQAGRICAPGNIYWIHCLLPVASAGLWQVAATSGAAITNCARPCVRNSHARFCVPLVRAQLHAISLSTDLIYLKSAFVHRLLQDASATHNLHIKTVGTPSHSLSDDLVTITEVLDQSNGENGCNTDTRRPHREVPSFSTSTKTAFLSEAPQAGSDTNSVMQFDTTNNHTTNGTADTYNFVFNTSNNLPWEQILSLAPVDRGLIKQLRFQLEEMEESKELLLRKQRTLTADLEECQQQLNQEKRDKRAAELRCHTAQRQNSDLQSRVEELEEELEEVSRKQRRPVVTSSVSPGLNVYAGELTQLMEERNAMREEIAHLQERLAAATTEKAGAADMELVYQKAKVHELEGRLELETSTKHRLQSTVERLKGHVEQLTGEREKLLVAVQTERQNSRHLTRSLREALENKERAERRLAEEENRRFITSNEVSSCVQEQLKLQQELSQFLLRYKEEELRSAGMYGEHLIGKADGQGTEEDDPEEECTVKVIDEGVGGGGKVEHLTSHPTNGSQESDRDATT